jgi:hypothetical protein
MFSAASRPRPLLAPVMKDRRHATQYAAYHADMNDVPANLPGHELVSAGLADLAAGRESEASLLVTMAAPRLRAFGLMVPAGSAEHPSYRLFELISENHADGDAHSRYNALIRRMVSFAHAAEHAVFS